MFNPVFPPTFCCSQAAPSDETWSTAENIDQTRLTVVTVLGHLWPLSGVYSKICRGSCVILFMRTRNASNGSSRDSRRRKAGEPRNKTLVFVAAAFPTLVQGSLWSPVTVPTVCAMPSHHRTVLARLSHSPKDFTTMYRQSTTLSARTCTIFTRQWHTHSGS